MVILAKLLGQNRLLRIRLMRFGLDHNVLELVTPQRTCLVFDAQRVRLNDVVKLCNFYFVDIVNALGLIERTCLLFTVNLARVGVV